MSYARFSDHSHVYVFASVQGHVECCGCVLGDQWEFHSAAELIEHLEAHVAAGHKVPAHLLDPETYDASDFETPENESEDER